MEWNGMEEQGGGACTGVALHGTARRGGAGGGASGGAGGGGGGAFMLWRARLHRGICSRRRGGAVLPVRAGVAACRVPLPVWTQ